MIQGWLERHRKTLLVNVPIIVFLLIVIMYVLGGRYVSTDDAYVQAAKAAISSNVPGQVQVIHVHDNQRVKKGDVLFTLDQRPYLIDVETARSQLILAKLQVWVLRANYKQREANMLEAENTFKYQQDEFERQTKLATSGISSQMQLNAATNSYHAAQQQYYAAQQELVATLANLNNDPEIAIENHPLVQEAQARLDHANLNLEYSTIKAPFDGIVTKVESLQVGDYIRTGDPVFALISDEDIWVEANFKETDITYMKPGQEVTLDIDAYPNKKFTGNVESMSPGTGSTFSLLPPENATGNWVKIVQRVPVRISIIQPKKKVQLSAGLSVNATVDTEHRRIYTLDSKE